MLNKEGIRELAYVVQIDDIQPIVGSDNCECAVVGGWHIMVRKGTFTAGDYAVYFEIDSKVDCTKPEFAFLISKHGKIKTQKYTFGGKGNFISQGLLMSFDDFIDEEGRMPAWLAALNLSRANGADIVYTFLTKDLGVTYAEAEDNKRKANSGDKYKKMAQRHPKLFKKGFIRWLMKYKFGRNLLFFFFGKKKDKKNGWPNWVAKTDEERIQNMPWILESNDLWVATEKIDGTSTTFSLKRGRFKNQFFICSRNVVFDEPDKKCFYETNVYTEMAEKYNIREVLEDILLSHPEYEWVTLQGETYGDGIQKRNYSLTDGEHRFAGFNFVTSKEGRWGTIDAKNLIEGEYNIPWVPVIDDCVKLPNSVDELLDDATGTSVLDEGMREGIVFRSLDGQRSFKAVSNEFLLKFHG